MLERLIFQCRDIFHVVILLLSFSDIMVLLKTCYSIRRALLTERFLRRLWQRDLSLRVPDVSSYRLYYRYVRGMSQCHRSIVSAGASGYEQYLGNNLTQAAPYKFELLRAVARSGHGEVLISILNQSKLGSISHILEGLLLSEAIAGGHLEIAKYIYHRYLPTVPAEFISNIHIPPRRRDLLNFLLEHSILSRQTLIENALYYGYLEDIEYLSSIEGFPIDYSRAFESALRRNHYPLITLMLNAGHEMTDPYVFEKVVPTCGRNVLQSLVSSGTPIDLSNRWPLLLACQYDNVEAIRFFLQYPFDWIVENHDIIRSALYNLSFKVMSELYLRVYQRRPPIGAREQFQLIALTDQFLRGTSAEREKAASCILARCSGEFYRDFLLRLQEADPSFTSPLLVPPDQELVEAILRKDVSQVQVLIKRETNITKNNNQILNLAKKCGDIQIISLIRSEICRQLRQTNMSRR